MCVFFFRVMGCWPIAPTPNLKNQCISLCLGALLWPVRQGWPYQYLRHRRYSSQDHCTTQASLPGKGCLRQGADISRERKHNYLRKIQIHFRVQVTLLWNFSVSMRLGATTARTLFCVPSTFVNFNPADTVTLRLPWHYVVWCAARDGVHSLQTEGIAVCCVVKAFEQW